MPRKKFLVGKIGEHNVKCHECNYYEYTTDERKAKILLKLHNKVHHPIHPKIIRLIDGQSREQLSTGEIRDI
jgi:acetyl-CoA carboxylase beta subunit